MRSRSASHKIVKGQTVITNDDGTTWIKQTRTAVSKLTDGIEIKQIQK